MSASHDGTLRVWDLETGETVRELVGHTALVYAVAARGDGGLVASGSEDNTLRLWDPSTGACLQVCLVCVGLLLLFVCVCAVRAGGPGRCAGRPCAASAHSVVSMNANGRA